MKKINVFTIAAALVAALSLFSCREKKAADSNKIEVTIACVGQNSSAYDFIDEDGHLDGVEPAIIKEIDSRLDDYKINLISSSYDDVTIGVQTGKYIAGVGTYFLTKERLQKYKIPKEPIAIQFSGFVINKKYADGIKSIPDLARKQKETGFSIVPLTAGEGNTYIYELYNEQHPELPVKFDYTSENTMAVNIGYVALGRYDGAVNTEARYKLTVLDEGSAYHEYKDNLVYIPITDVGAYTLFYKNADQKFVDEYIEALRQIKNDGSASKISEKYLGRDVYNLAVHNLAE